MINKEKLYRIDRPRYDSVFKLYNYVVQVMDTPKGDFFFRDQIGFDHPAQAQKWIDNEKQNKIGEVQ